MVKGLGLRISGYGSQAVGYIDLVNLGQG